jgi:multiple sugar transport system substrate-binding protein
MVVRAVRLVAAVATIVLLGGVGCSSPAARPQDPNVLTVWTTEDQADRVAAQQKIMEDWAAKNGATVKLVPVGEDQLTTVLTSSAAAGDLPDLIGALSLNGVSQLQTDELLDTEAAARIVDELGPDTFSPRALELTSAGGQQLSVPSDGFAQLLVYRKDLFAAAGLPEPKTYADLQNAATRLNQGRTTGIVAGTAPGDSFTQQTFEQVALANDCQLVDDQGDITLTSPQCQEAFDFYVNLIKSASAPGNQDADTTRATYFAGDAAMVIWSSFLLDELAGLRKDALPTCPQCEGDPQWLAKNSGVVTTLQGPDGTAPAAFGEVVSWSVLTDANEKTKDLVTHMMGDGYLDWLGIAPEGKVPTRPEYVDDWGKLEAGVDKKELLSNIYSAETLKAVAESPGSFDRWGIAQGQGALAGAVGGQFVAPQAIAKIINSGTSGADAAAEAQKAAEQIKTDLGG